MEDLRESIRRLVAADRLDQALEKVASLVARDPELAREVTLLRLRLSKSTQERRRGFLSSSQEARTRTELAHSILQILDEASESPSIDIPDSLQERVRPGQLAVFVSYSHADAAVAERLAATLEAHDLCVLIDSRNMAAGEPIRDFIARAVDASDAVVSLVSSISLLSAWVAMETFRVLDSEALAGRRRFIAAYLDEDFLESRYRLLATRKIDDKIQEIDQLVPEYQANRIDTSDLNDEKTRLFELRNNLGTILGRLKGSLCVDLRGDGFDSGVARIIAAVRQRGASQ